jgi:NAD(P)H dehydrogenase (quinone)
MVAARDVADVAAAVLAGEAEVDDGDVVVLTGPEALSFTDVAERISTVFARAVEYDPVTAEAARSALREGGLSSWQVDGRLELYEWISNGAMAGVTEDVRRTTGRAPRPLEDWLSHARAVFLRPGGSPAPGVSP